MKKDFLLNKNILITGATSGIGNAIANKLKESGGNVIGVSRRKKDIDNFNYIDRKRIFGLFAKDDLERTEFEPNLFEMLDLWARP